MNESIASATLPNLAEASLPQPDPTLLGAGRAHPPRILLLYGSLRPQSFSRKLALEAELRAWLGKVWHWHHPRLPGRELPWAEWPGVTYPW